MHNKQQIIKIPRASDAELISCFKEIAKLPNDHVNISSITFFGFETLSDVDLNTDYAELEDSYIADELAVIDTVLKCNSAIIDSISIQIFNLTISFYRGGNVPSENKSAIFDDIIISTPYTSKSEDEKITSSMTIELVHIIYQKLHVFDPKQNVIGTTEAQREVNAVHNDTLKRLETINTELISTTHKYRNTLDQEYADKSNKLNTQLSEEYKLKENKLAAQKQELQEERKQLEDSSNTHARREIRRDILKEIKNRQSEFKLTSGTNKLRYPIGIAMIVLIAIFVTLGGIAAQEFYILLQGTDYNKIIISGGYAAIYSLGAITSIIFMIRWMNKWFEQHSQSEFALKRFELDMERASWLVETVFEWNKNNAAANAMPTQLIECLSKGLFSTEPDKLEQVQHPADQLASALLGSASSIKLKAGDSSIEVDPRKLAKKKVDKLST